MTAINIPKFMTRLYRLSGSCVIVEDARADFFVFPLRFRLALAPTDVLAVSV